MIMRNLVTILLSTLLILLYSPLPAQNEALSQEELLEAQMAGGPEIAIIERLDEYLPEEITLIDQDGQPVMLYDLLDKPTALALVYYRCPGICSPFMREIADVISRSDMDLGKDYQVLTISFDYREGPQLAATNRNNYHNLIKGDFDPDGWRFFVADSANVAKITESVGFRYRRAGLDFLHTTALIFVSEEGKITRYLHGTYFLPIDLKLAVVETSAGRSGPSFSRVLAYCYTYDPAGQQYVLNVTKIAGTLILFVALLVFGILMWFRPRKAKSEQTQS